MLTLGSYNPNQQEYTLTNAKALVSVKAVIDVVRHYMDNTFILIKFFTLLTLALTGLPLFYGFGFWLLYHRKRFSKVMKSTAEIEDLDDYLFLKNGLNKMEEMLPKLKNLGNIDLKRVPWLLRFTFTQMKKFSSSLVTYQGWLKSRLNNYNTPQFKSSSKISFLSESELWENRNHAYSYWM